MVDVSPAQVARGASMKEGKMSDNREHATTNAMNGGQIHIEKLEQENAALRARLKGVEEVEEYKNHEFCKDVECTALEYNTCSPVICHKTAKHFHKWLKQHGYKIVKVASIV